MAGFVAYTLWGFLPVYFKAVIEVSSLEILAHRIIWAVPFGALIITLRRQWPEIRAAFRHRRLMLWLTTSALLIAVNWFVYIIAVATDRIFQASLGYYINPLIFVLFGVAFFGERLRTLQKFAVAMAAIGVAVLTSSGGELPWIALFLGTSFAFYGVIRKRTVIGAMPGLLVETAILAPFALLWLGWMINAGQASFASASPSLTALLLAAGPITVVPLVAFAIAAKRLNLTTVGFMQFLAPSLQFATGIYYGEQLTVPRIICFGCIWIAVAFFSVDAIKESRRRNKATAAS
ncbi:MAG: EamA family transporter RarD [Woeseiaceae bacterium]